MNYKLIVSRILFKTICLQNIEFFKVISGSVADALDYCQTAVKNDSFNDVTGTCLYLRTFNCLFDRMNSRSLFGKGTKSPMNIRVIEEVRKDFSQATNYILSLTLEDQSNRDTCHEPLKKRAKKSPLLVSSQRKKGFLGFLINMRTYVKLYELYIQTNHLKYLLTYKTSQDHVELLFCSVRGSLGRNNNPTTVEFTRNLKKILLGASHSSNFSNSLLQDDTTLLKLPNKLEDSLHLCLNEFLPENDESKDWIDLYLSNTESEYKSDVLVYISGYVQRTIMRKEQCVQCKAYISNLKIVQSSKLLNLKNRGPLVIPSAEFVKIIKVANSLLESKLQEPKIFGEKNLLDKLSIKATAIINSVHPTLLAGISDHSIDCSFTSDHRIIMIRKIITLFSTLIIHHRLKCKNKKDVNIRKLYSKLILFKNQ